MEKDKEEPNFIQYSRPKKICICNLISEEEIVDAILKGNDTLEKIQLATKASTSCGGCEGRILEILKRETKSKK